MMLHFFAKELNTFLFEIHLSNMILEKILKTCFPVCIMGFYILDCNLVFCYCIIMWWFGGGGGV